MAGRSFDQTHPFSSRRFGIKRFAAREAHEIQQSNSAHLPNRGRFRFPSVFASNTIGIVTEDKIIAAIRFEGEDLVLLKALEAEERLSRSDVVRRAVRAYAKQLGVEAPKAKKARAR